MGCWGEGRHSLHLEEIRLNDREKKHLGSGYKKNNDNCTLLLSAHFQILLTEQKEIWNMDSNIFGANNHKNLRHRTLLKVTTSVFAPLKARHTPPLRACQRFWSRFWVSLHGGFMIMIMQCKSETNWIMADLRGLCRPPLLQIDWCSPGRILARVRAEEKQYKIFDSGLMVLVLGE